MYNQVLRTLNSSTTQDSHYQDDIALQNTQPLPRLASFNLVQLRRFFDMSALDVARATGVRYASIYRMEHSLECKYEDVMRVLRFFSRRLGYELHLRDVPGLYVREIHYV